MKNRAQAIIMAICATAFLGGAVVFGAQQLGQSSARADLRNAGIEVPVETRSFIERDERRYNPTTERFDTLSDDEVEFTFRLADGTTATASQPIAQSRYNQLVVGGELSALYLEDDPDGAELLDDGEFVAATTPFWILALLCAVLALCAVGIAYTSSRPSE